MIQLEEDFFKGKPWGRQANTISLFMFLLSRADSEGRVNIDIKGMSHETGICCTSKIKFCLRQLEYSGNLAIEKINGKRIFIINTNVENDKSKDAGDQEQEPGPAKKKGLHTFVKI